MKKILLAISIAILAFAIAPTKSLAVASVPNSSVWFTPANAAAGSVITLNALVYNNQAEAVTCTVVFATSATTIGSDTVLIPAQSAKTVIQPWTMPTTATVLTASVSKAIGAKNESIPSLVGTIGTVTVETGALSTLPGINNWPSWLQTPLSKAEAFRVTEAQYYATLRDQTRVTLGLTGAAPQITTGDGLTPLKFDNPLQYIVLIYSTACAFFFGSVVIFYIAIILIILLLLRFIINLFF